MQLILLAEISRCLANIQALGPKLTWITMLTSATPTTHVIKAIAVVTQALGPKQTWITMLTSVTPTTRVIKAIAAVTQALEPRLTWTTTPTSSTPTILVTREEGSERNQTEN